MSTALCKKAIELKIGRRDNSLKRTEKFRRGENSIRIFKSKDAAFTTIINSEGLVFVFRGNLFEDDADNLEKRMIEVAKKIKHCGDYGDLYWNPKTKAVWLVLGDADGDEECGGTPFDEIKKLFFQAGAKDVEIEAEADPGDYDYKDLGRYGIDYHSGEEIK